MVVVFAGLVCGDSVRVLALCCCRAASVITPTKKTVTSQARRPPTPAVKHNYEVVAKQEEVAASVIASDSLALPPPSIEMLSPASTVNASMVVTHIASESKAPKSSRYSTSPRSVSHSKWSKEPIDTEEGAVHTDEAKEAHYACEQTLSLPGGEEDAERYTLLILPNGNIGYLFADRGCATIVDSESNKPVMTRLNKNGVCVLPIATTLSGGRFVMVLHGNGLPERDQKMLIYDETLDRKTMFFEDRVITLNGALFSSQLERICAMTVCPNGLLVTGAPGGTIKVWAPSMLCCQKTIAPCTLPFIVSEVLSADGGRREYSMGEEYLCSITALSNTYVAYGLYDGTIKLLNLNNGAKKTLGTCHYGPVTALTMLSDDTFASGSSDTMIKIWQTDDGMGVGCINVLKGHRGGILSLVARKTKRGCELISLATDGEIKVWRMHS
jgi:WD40 repeat protein